jgi:2-phospho-L-lactate guanylyltransferase
VRFDPLPEAEIVARLQRRAVEPAHARACARLALGDARRAFELATGDGPKLRAAAERFARAALHGEMDQRPWEELLRQAMLRDVLAALAEVRSLYRLVVVTGERRAQALARAHDAVLVDDRDERGQSAAAARGVARALEIGAERVVLVPGDCPALDPGELHALLAAGEETPGVTVIPDRHGTGTNGLVLSPPGAIAPAFGEGSFERHCAAARGADVRLTVARLPSLALDIDTPDDLAALRGTHVHRATASVVRSLGEGTDVAVASSGSAS